LRELETEEVDTEEVDVDVRRRMCREW